MRRRIRPLAVLLALLLLIPSCSYRVPEGYGSLSIRVQDSFQPAKGITYDGLTSDTITAYRVIVTDGGEMIADSGAVSGSEIILTGIAPGTYTFTVQGLIGDIPVAETSSEHTIGSATTLSLPLKDIKAGAVSDLTITVRPPYTGDYPHTDDSITVSYDDSTTTLSVADGTLTYTGDADGVWTYHAKADALKAGAVTITFRAGGNEPIDLTTGGVLFAGVGNVCVFDAEKGEATLNRLPKPVFNKEYMDAYSSWLNLVNYEVYPDEAVLYYFFEGMNEPTALNDFTAIKDAEGLHIATSVIGYVCGYFVSCAGYEDSEIVYP